MCSPRVEDGVRPRMVWYRYRREFPHGAQECYRWLTDYQDHDPDLANRNILQERQVESRSPERVVMRVRNDVLGRSMAGRAEVRLFPEELRYEARPLEGDGGGLLYTYRLTPLGPGRARLEVAYGHRARKLKRWLQLQLARLAALRRIARMWDGFADAMAKDLG
ncbi:MAG: hypothetical protein QOE90_3178 [Thermoplasmata archaeon]|nr:hypothetical protein [Thermoplasmata archaeon]